MNFSAEMDSKRLLSGRKRSGNESVGDSRTTTLILSGFFLLTDEHPGSPHLTFASSNLSLPPGSLACTHPKWPRDPPATCPSQLIRLLVSVIGRPDEHFLAPALGCPRGGALQRRRREEAGLPLTERLFARRCWAALCFQTCSFRLLCYLDIRRARCLHLPHAGSQKVSVERIDQVAIRRCFLTAMLLRLSDWRFRLRSAVFRLRRFQAGSGKK